MTSAISQSSVGTVVEDLVSYRSIPLKSCMIVLNCAQLISSWIAVGYFIKTYESWSTLELTLSIVLLLTGNYLIPGIANVVIYVKRWRHSSVANRKQLSEENKQAWVCLRISLTLLGVPTVGRYIETILVSRKLNQLESKHVDTSMASHKEGSQLHPIGNSRLGSSVNQLKANSAAKNHSEVSGLGGMAHGSSSNAISENIQRKVRKARRQYKRCEYDGSLMALISGSVGGGPMAIGLGFLYFHRDELRNMQSDQMAVVFTSFVLNLLWLAATLTHFYPARHELSEAEFERGVGSTHVGGLVLLFSSHLVQITLRILCFVVFTNWFTFYVLIPILFHWMLGTIILVAYRSYIRSKSVGRPLAERLRQGTGSFFSSLFFGYVGIFDFVNANEGKTRMRYLIYYTFYYAENIIMLIVWILRNPTTQIRFPIPFVGCILGLFWLGFILFQLYLYYFSYSPYGTSIIGLCKKKKTRQGHYAEEVREPVFGVPLAHSAVPFWKQHQQDDYVVASTLGGSSEPRNPHTKVSRPAAVPDHGESPSIMSSKSQFDTPSIYSQPSSQAKFVPGKPKHNPNVKAPPVVQQKAKNAPTKLNTRVVLSSDSSSSSEDLPVFSAKPLHLALSQPDLSVSSAGAVEKRDRVKSPPRERQLVETTVRGDYGPTPTTQSRPESNSRSLDNIAMMVPAAQPNKSTKRIGAAPVSANIKGAVRPLPSKEQLKSLQNKRDPRSLPGGGGGGGQEDRARRH